MDIILKDLNTFQKYCDNRMNWNEFKNGMLLSYSDENYIENLWSDFTKNPTRFITSRSEDVLFNYIVEQILVLNYKG
jgi:hypothetical protein